MSIRLLFATAAIVLALSAPYRLVAAAETRPVIRLTNGEWPPWMSQDLPEGGPVSQLVREAWEVAGYRVEWGWMPWARGYALAAAGRWDGTTGWSYTPERARAFLYSEPVFFGETVLLSRRSHPVTWRTLDDLRHIRLGITLSYTYGEELDRMIADGHLQTDPAPNDETNLQKLLAGRIDAFPLERHVAGALMRRHFPTRIEDITCTRQPLRRASYHLLISRKRPDAQALVQAFNSGLARLQADGRAAEILAAVRQAALRCEL